MAKRKTRSSSLSSEASDQSSSGSDTDSRGTAAAATATVSDSADSSDDSDSDPEITIKKPVKSSTSSANKNPAYKQTSKRGGGVRGSSTSERGRKNKNQSQRPVKKQINTESSDDEMLASSTAVSSAATSPNKNAKSKTGGIKKPDGGARPNTRQRGGTKVRRSRHVTGRNHASLIDTDSEMEMTSTANESVTSSPRKKSGGRPPRNKKEGGECEERTKASSFSGEDSAEEASRIRKTGPRASERGANNSSINDRILGTHHLEKQTSSAEGAGGAMGANPSSQRLPPPLHPGNASGVILPPVRRTFDGCTPLEERKCPTPGCDSSGHLSGSGGKLDRHFTQEACPMFHNMTGKECREFRLEINKKHSARRKATNLMHGAMSPLGSPSSEQKRHSQMVSINL